MHVCKLGSGKNRHEMNSVSLDLVANQVTIQLNLLGTLLECEILSYLNGGPVVTI